jgi:hypothetical protein
MVSWPGVSRENRRGDNGEKKNQRAWRFHFRSVSSEK